MTLLNSTIVDSFPAGSNDSWDPTHPLDTVVLTDDAGVEWVAATYHDTAANSEGVLVYRPVNRVVGGNLLPAADASFETGVGSWGNLVNVTMGTSTAWALDGTHSLTATTTAAVSGSEWACARVPVVGGRPYTGMITFAPDPNASQVEVGILQSTGTVDWQVLTLSTTAPTQFRMTTVLDAATTSAGLVCAVLGAPAAGTVFSMDEGGLFAGTATTWVSPLDNPTSTTGIGTISQLLTDGRTLYIITPDAVWTRTDYSPANTSP